MAYKPYMHVERINTEECEGLLDNDQIYVTAKVDGSNGVIWYEDGEICAGSRKRKLSADDDNAGFWHWAHSDTNEANLLRSYLHDHPTHFIYGEWMGGKRFIGHIKDYDPEAHGKFIIFDVFDLDELAYLSDHTWRAKLARYGIDDKYTTAVLATLDHPTMEDIEKVAEANKFLLNNSERKGEGVVLKCASWRNKFGRQQHGKLVLEEYKQAKRRPKFTPAGEVETDIINLYVTDAELSKTIAKVCTTLDAPEFDKKNPKMVGMFVSFMWKDLLAECPDFVKRFKKPIINFAILEAECKKKCRSYIGL